MATTTVKNNIISFSNEKQYDSFMSRIKGNSVTTNENVKKTRENVRAVKEIKIDGKTYRV